MPPKNLIRKSARIYIAGHSGMVGSAIVGCLGAEGYDNLLMRTHEDLDLTDQIAVRDFFHGEKMDYVVLAAAKVGGIQANSSNPAEFIYQNLMIESNVIHEAFRTGVKRLLFLGSSCIYPKYAPQPLKEEYLLSDRLEPTNEPYAIAKIAGIKLCQAYNQQYQTKYRAVMPANLYGPNDNFDLENSHVLPALIRKFHLAKLAMQRDWQAIQENEAEYGLAIQRDWRAILEDEAEYGPIPAYIRSNLETIAGTAGHPTAPNSGAIQLWGSGSPKREFLYVDDLASACLLLMNLPDDRYDALCTTPLKNRTAPAEVSSTANHPLAARDSPKVPHINIGTGKDLTIAELSEIIKEVIGFTGDVNWDRTKPDGTPQKLLDVSRIMQIGWQPRIKLTDGIHLTYASYLKH
jgi:GDP-L-fucose synthase